MKSNEIKVLGDYVVIRPDKEKIHKTAGGLEYTETQSGEVRYREGVIIASNVDLIKEGDVIVYDKVAGYNHTFDDDTLRIIRLRDIVAVHDKT